MTMNTITSICTRNLAKYAQSAPRYTSYPTALKFSHIQEHDVTLASENYGSDSLSLYIHIPFCHTLCYYCGCNKIVTRHQDKADSYLDYLQKEIEIKRPLHQEKQIASLHLGGGSPSFLTSEQHKRLMALLDTNFVFESECEKSIELDPRHVDSDYLQTLSDLGYNRVSFGLQDVDHKVQTAINRVQSTAHISDLVFAAKTHGFHSVNLDLIYGLPHQTLETFSTTLSATMAMMPDRVSLFSYAHLPTRFAAQRKIDESFLPDATLKAALYDLAVNHFTSKGYDMIGLDHFARTTDTLAIAKKYGELHRNFQGYTTRGDTDLLGIGVSAISTIGNAYGQNPKVLKDYYECIDKHSPLTKVGLLLTDDDLIRREVIMALMCNLNVEKSAIESKFSIIFDEYFAEELKLLEEVARDGLIELGAKRLHVPEKARIYIRAICAYFDAYFKDAGLSARYSKAI